MTPTELAHEWGADGVVTGDEIRSLADTAAATLRGEKALVKLGIASKTQSQDHGFRYWQNISGLPFESLNGGGSSNDIEAQERLARHFGGESVGSQSFFGPTGTEAEAAAIADYRVDDVKQKYVDGYGVETQEATAEYVDDASDGLSTSSSSGSSSTRTGHQITSKKLLGVAAVVAAIGYGALK